MSGLLIIGWKPGLHNAVASNDLSPVVLVTAATLNQFAEELMDDRYQCILVSDISDVSACLSALERANVALTEIESVFTDQEIAVICAAIIGSLVGDTRVSVTSAIASRDKVVQKRAVAAGGLRVPAVTEINDIDSASGIICENLSYPLVLKPVAGGGTRDTFRVNTDVELADAFNRIRVSGGNSNRNQYMLEEFTTGSEIHIDGVLVGGSIDFISVSRYRANLLDLRSGVVASSVVFDPSIDSELYDRSRDFAETALRSIGQRDTVFHLEAFIVEDGSLVFSECGARAGGAFVTNAVWAKFGVDLRRCALDLAIGVEPTIQHRPTSQHIGFTLLPSPPGRLSTVPAAEDIYSIPGVLNVEITRHPGDQMKDMSIDSAQRLGMAVVGADSVNELEQRMDHLVAMVQGAVVVHA